MKNLYYLFIILFSLSYSQTRAQDFSKVQYGSEARQYLDIYIAPSNTPTPVYFDAHGNGGNTNMPNAIIDALKAEGISVVAWESLTSVNTPTEVETGWTDAELMFAWVKENAQTYNFDTTRYIIGGSSRGSILSWKYGHRPNANIKGLYMYNALPDGVWADTTWWYAPDEVTISSPPIFFVYNPEPGVVGDSHDPENGMVIMDKYDELGIGDRDTLIHSIGTSANTDKYQFLIEFIRSVINEDRTNDVNPVILSLDSNEGFSSTLKAFPNPFQGELEIVGLKGGEYFILRNTFGTLLQEGNKIEEFQLGALNSGVYLLMIQSQEEQKVLRLIKE